MRYLRVYIMLMKLNISVLFSYRGNFINSFIGSFLFGIFIFISIALLTTNISTLYGWSRDEIIFLSVGYSIAIGFFHTLFSRNFERFSRIIHFGELDTILIKPLDSQFLISLWEVNYTSLIRVLAGIVLAAYFIHKLGISITLLTVSGYLILLLCGILIFYSVWFIIITLTIWFTRLSNIVELLYNVNTVSRFPREIYRDVTGFFFYILIPLTFVVITPTKVLFQTATINDVLGLLFFAVVFFTISRKFWKFALRYYTSASS